MLSSVPIACLSSQLSQCCCRETKELNKKDAEWSKGNKLWLTGAGLATAAYFVLSGQYISIATDWGYDEEGDDEIE